ncbi:MAG: fimbrillin family protein, partial [Muribaculaceae bacterium]|nr:fimbrillin family protein [Muribaculaceae bacterium]
MFKPSVGSSWSKGAAGSRSSDALIRIDSIDAMDGDMQLYLVSEEEDLAAYSGSAADKGPASRGYTSTSIAGSFGLSAICYNSSSEAGDDALRDLTANFASNLETRPNAAGSTYWEPADRLVWPGSGRIRFMGYAPYASADNGITYDASVYPTLSFSVKESVKDQVDLLTAVKDVSGKGGEAIDFTFNHALAAITVRSGEAMLSGTITKVAIKNVYKAGKLPLGTAIPVWTATGSSDGSFEVETKAAVLPEAEGSSETSYTTPGLRIAGISKGENGKTDDDGLTFFMIPQTLPEGAKLEVTLTDKMTGNTWTLSAPLAGKHNGGSGNEVSNRWEAGKLYTYAISTQGIVVQPYLKMVKKTVTETGVTETGIFSEPYEGFAEHDPTKYINIQSTGVLPYSGAIHDVERTAYMTITVAGGQSKTVAADDIKMEYSTDGGSSWTACDDNGWIDYDPVAAASKTAEDPTASRTGSLILPKLDGFKNLTAASSAKSGVTNLSATESANCYMINSPGDYSFRTVYGNSLKGGSIDNSVLTLPAGRVAGMKYFVDHKNDEITDGDIATQLRVHSTTLSEAFILWQDSPGLISRVKYENGFIKFHVDERTIAEGNAVIALRDSNHDIVWSWHIWVTDKDWSEGKCRAVNDNDGVEHKLAPSMLGRCEKREASPGRDISLRFSFTYTGGEKPITVPADRFMTTKNGTDTEVRLSDLRQQNIAGSAAGDNTYYQWGRKDAMIPGIYTDTVDPASTSASNNAIWGFTGYLWGELTMKNKPVFDYPEDYKFQQSEADNGVTLGYAISNPHRFVMGVDGVYDHDYRKHWHNPGSETYVESKGIMYNAWNSKNTNFYPNDAKTVGKTIYDPCPPGYHVPLAKVFNGDVMNHAGSYTATSWLTKINIESDRSWRYNLKNGTELKNVIYATGVR